MDSDECHLAEPKPFDASEVDAVAKALYGSSSIPTPRVRVKLYSASTVRSKGNRSS